MTETQFTPLPQVLDNIEPGYVVLNHVVYVKERGPTLTWLPKGAHRPKAERLMKLFTLPEKHWSDYPNHGYIVNQLSV